MHQAPNSIAVIGWMRGGTTVLRQFIGSTRQSFDLGEVFHSDTSLPANFWGFLHSKAIVDPNFRHPSSWLTAWSEFIHEQSILYHANTLCFDLKVSYFEFTLRRSGVDARFFFDSANVRYIYLERRNLAAQALSLCVAQLTNVWSQPNRDADERLLWRLNQIISEPREGDTAMRIHMDPDETMRIHMDPDEFYSRVDWLHQEQMNVRKFAHNLNAECFVYEDLFEDDGRFSADTCARIAEVCRLSPSAFDRTPVTKKQRHSQLLDGFSNPCAIYKRFKDTPFEHMLVDHAIT